MKNFITFTQKLAVFFVLVLFCACQNEENSQQTKTSSKLAQRLFSTKGRLIIENDSDVKFNYSVMCLGTEDDMPVLKYELYGENTRYKILPHTVLTLDSMNTLSTPGIDPLLAIDDWMFLDTATNTSATFSGSGANNTYGKYFDPNDHSLGKYSIWRVLDLKCANFRFGILNADRIELKIGLPDAENAIDPISETYGDNDFLELNVRSEYTPSGDIRVNISNPPLF